ncbi:hypothetical protein [Natrinema versiforme]|uniref:hypothetical protein n=1 Tax=Natrinema versiforme TaxID=88724 RepID=UPI001268F2CC|nr:hypothetical protein [Natrinema versiforme]
MTDHIQIIAIIVGIIGSVAVIINSRLLAKKRDVYTPVYNKVNENIKSINYDRDSGEFDKIWETFDGHIKDKIREDDLEGWLVRFDGMVVNLNTFLYNYKLKLEAMSDSSDLVIKSGNEYMFDMGGERGQVLLDDFINQHGCEIVTTLDKGDLWKRLRRNSEEGYHHTEIKNWDPTGKRIDFLWECREEVYRDDPNFIGSGRVNLSMIPPDGVGLKPGFCGDWIDVTEAV